MPQSSTRDRRLESVPVIILIRQTVKGARMASVSPESPIATCRSALDAWLDCNDGELAGLLAMDEVSSDAIAAFCNAQRAEYK